MPNSQKIVHLIGTIGQYDASYKLREVARSQAAAGADVTIVAFSATKGIRQLVNNLGVRFQVVRKRWVYDPFAGRQLAQVLRELRADTVFLWGRRATDAALTVRRALPEARQIATLVNVPQLANPWWPNKSLHVVDWIVVEREETREAFIDAGQGKERVQVIPPGMAKSFVELRNRREVLAQLGLSNDARIVALAGPLERWQLADEAIWCFELIRILHDQATLVIVGEGSERSRLERFARQVSDPGVVRFVTQVGLLDDVLAHAEIYWQPGECQAIPTTLLTAMSHGLPVVASDIPAHHAVIQPEANGFLASPAKRAIWARCTDRLLRDSELCSKFGQAARQTVEEKYALVAMIEAYKLLVHPLERASSYRARSMTGVDQRCASVPSTRLA